MVNAVDLIIAFNAVRVDLIAPFYDISINHNLKKSRVNYAYQL